MCLNVKTIPTNDLVAKALYLPDFNPYHSTYLVQKLNKCTTVEDIYLIFPNLVGKL